MGAEVTFQSASNGALLSGGLGPRALRYSGTSGRQKHAREGIVRCVRVRNGMLSIRALLWIDSLSLLVDGRHAIAFVKPQHVQLVLVIPSARSKLQDSGVGPFGNFDGRPTPKFRPKLSGPGHLDGFQRKGPFTPQAVLHFREQIHTGEAILEGLQLFIGPCSPRKAFTDPLHFEGDHDCANQVGEEDWIGLYGIGYGPRDFQVLKRLIRAAKVQVGRRTDRARHDNLLEDGQVRNKTSKVFFIFNRPSSLRAAGNGLPEFLELGFELT